MRHFRGKHREHVALDMGKLSALEMAGIIEMIDMNRADLRLPVPADFGIAPIQVRATVINVHVDVHIHVHIYVTDIRDVDRLLDDVDVAPPLQKAAAGVVAARAKIADLDESVVIRSDIAFPVHPGADADPNSTCRFRRQWRPANTRTF